MSSVDGDEADETGDERWLIEAEIGAGRTKSGASAGKSSVRLVASWDGAVVEMARKYTAWPDEARDMKSDADVRSYEKFLEEKERDGEVEEWMVTWLLRRQNSEMSVHHVFGRKGDWCKGMATVVATRGFKTVPVDHVPSFRIDMLRSSIASYIHRYRSVPRRWDETQAVGPLRRFSKSPRAWREESSPESGR